MFLPSPPSRPTRHLAPIPDPSPICFDLCFFYVQRGRLGGGARTARTWTMFRKLRDFICLCLESRLSRSSMQSAGGEGKRPSRRRRFVRLPRSIDARSIFPWQKSTFLAESRFHPSIHDKLNGPSLCEAALDDDGGKRAKAARGNVKEGKEERADGGGGGERTSSSLK